MKIFIEIYLIWQIIGFMGLFSVLWCYAYDKYISKWIEKIVDYCIDKIFL